MGRRSYVPLLRANFYVGRKTFRSKPMNRPRRGAGLSPSGRYRGRDGAGDYKLGLAPLEDMNRHHSRIHFYVLLEIQVVVDLLGYVARE